MSPTTRSWSGDDGKPKQLPWEDWREGEEIPTSAWMRATSPAGDASFQGRVLWSGELGFGHRAPEPDQAHRDARAVSKTHTAQAGHGSHGSHGDDEGHGHAQGHAHEGDSEQVEEHH